VSFDLSVEILAQLRQEGKIRNVALSNVTQEHIERARKIVCAVQKFRPRWQIEQMVVVKLPASFSPSRRRRKLQVRGAPL
jgi:aryl-alcohol dehydrogenase-like predicted oxidoreductase